MSLSTSWSERVKELSCPSLTTTIGQKKTIRKKMEAKTRQSYGYNSCIHFFPFLFFYLKKKKTYLCNLRVFFFSIYCSGKVMIFLPFFCLLLMFLNNFNIYKVILHLLHLGFVVFLSGQLFDISHLLCECVCVFVLTSRRLKSRVCPDTATARSVVLRSLKERLSQEMTWLKTRSLWRLKSSHLLSCA